MIQPRRTFLLSALAAVVLPVTKIFAAENPDKPTDDLFQTLMNATVANDHDRFLSVCDDTMKAALTKPKLESVSTQIAPRAKDGYDAAYLGELSQRGFAVHLWRLRFKYGWGRRAGDHERQGRQGRRLLPALNRKPALSATPGRFNALNLLVTALVHLRLDPIHAPPKPPVFPPAAARCRGWLGPGIGRFPPPGARSVWNVVKYEGRDYLTLRNVADFYKLQYSRPGARSVVLTSPGCSIRGEAGSKELIINGVKFIMSSDLVEPGDNVLLSRLDLTKLVEPVLRPNRIRGASAIRTVVIDPGHGGYDRGATSIYGCEANFALDTCLRLRELLLKRGFRVEMTRIDRRVHPAGGTRRLRQPVPRRHLRLHPLQRGQRLRHGHRDVHAGAAFRAFHGRRQPDRLLPRALRGQRRGPREHGARHRLARLAAQPAADGGPGHQAGALLRAAADDDPGGAHRGRVREQRAEAARIATPAYRQAEAEAIALAIENYQAATAAPGPPPILAGAGKPEHPSLSITPGMVQMQNGIPSIGANTPLDQTVNRVNNLQQGPTVVVPHNN